MKKLRLGTLLTGLAAAVTYALTLATYVFPGEPARLVSEWGGFDTVTSPLHGVCAKVASWFGQCAFLGDVATRFNVFSLVCGVVAAMLVFRLVAFFVRRTAEQEDTVKFAETASLLAGGMAAGAFIFSTAIWQSATHLEYRLFDVTLALLLFACVAAVAKYPSHPAWLSLVAGTMAALGLAESPIFIFAAPFAVLVLVSVLIRNGKGVAWPTIVFLGALGLTFPFLLNGFSAAWYASGPAAADAGLVGAFVQLVKSDLAMVSRFTGRPGWLIATVLAILPFLACAFAARRGLNNDRRWSQYAFHLGMTVCCILAYATPLAPEALFRPWGVPPVALSTLVALVAGYLVAYWYFLAKCPLPVAREGNDLAMCRIGRSAAPAVAGIFGTLLALAAFLNTFSCTKGRGAFADRCAQAIIERLGDRTWFVTDGTLDEHLRIAAATSGKELTLVCLQRDMDDAYLKTLAATVKAKGLKAGRADLPMTLQLGVLPFLQDWFGADPDVTKKAAVFGVPDFWFMGEKTPVPEDLFFAGATSVKAADSLKLREGFLTFWKEFEDILPAANRGDGSRAIAKCDDPVDALRLQLRRHVGFVANNLGVFLQDQKHDREAFAMYELVLKEIDPDNVCALFNEFEMARAGVPEATAHKREIEKQLKAIVDDSRRRYLLWSLSRYYGYIRSPEIFARMGYAWARSGQTGNAIAQVQRAIDFVPTDKRAALMNMMAAIYASGNQTEKSRRVYEDVLAKDKNNRDALMGLTRLSLQTGDSDAARNYLRQAMGDRAKEADGVEFALLKMMDNDLAAARLAMQRVTDAHPKSLQAWSLLAGIILQQADQEKNEGNRKKILEELEQTILPKMESVAENPRDYFLQITRALVLMRKGPMHRKDARNALVLADMARPDVSVVGEMILNLDISLDDGESAGKHARSILRRNRYDKLANYVMGSLRLKEGDYATAETFLRVSCEQEKPLAAAQNDLAETLRRLQRYDEAEAFARLAVKNNPDLYVAWETLGSTLLGAGKDLDEAEKCTKKAIDLSKKDLKIEDMRLQITLARVQIARGTMDKARQTLRALRKRQSELSNYDRDQLERLIKQTKTK